MGQRCGEDETMQEGVLLSWCGGGARRAREDTNVSWLGCDDELTAFCWDGILLFFFFLFRMAGCEFKFRNGICRDVIQAALLWNFQNFFPCLKRLVLSTQKNCNHTARPCLCFHTVVVAPFIQLVYLTRHKVCSTLPSRNGDSPRPNVKAPYCFRAYYHYL